MVVHIVGQPIRLGKRVRQRCSWCGELLIDLDLGTVVERWIPTEPGELATVEGKNRLAVVEHANGSALPEGACFKTLSLGDRALALMAKLQWDTGIGTPETSELRDILDALKARG